MYAPLASWGNWPDSETNALPKTGATNTPILYTIQPIARERIVTIKASAGKTNVIRGTGYRNQSLGIQPNAVNGADGTSWSIATDSLGQGPLSGVQIDSARKTKNQASSNPISNAGILMSNPWVMLSREDAQRSVPNADWYVANAYPNVELATGGQEVTGSNFFGDTRGSLKNANDPIWQDPYFGAWASVPWSSADVGFGIMGWGFPQTPAYYYSLYAWSPGGQWWETLIPNLSETEGQFNASCTPPTMRFDLTEAYTQSMQPGGGLNSPYPGHAPKGSRLNRIWVNFGLWGNEPKGKTLDHGLPGYVASHETRKPNSVLDEYYMAFNLVCELPGSQARMQVRDHAYVQISQAPGDFFNTPTDPSMLSSTVTNVENGLYGEVIKITRKYTNGNSDDSFLFHSHHGIGDEELGGSALGRFIPSTLWSEGDGSTPGPYFTPMVSARNLAAEINRVAHIAAVGTDHPDSVSYTHLTLPTIYSV